MEYHRNVSITMLKRYLDQIVEIKQQLKNFPFYVALRADDYDKGQVRVHVEPKEFKLWAEYVYFPTSQYRENNEYYVTRDGSPVWWCNCEYCNDLERDFSPDDSVIHKIEGVYTKFRSFNGADTTCLLGMRCIEITPDGITLHAPSLPRYYVSYLVTQLNSDRTPALFKGVVMSIYDHTPIAIYTLS